LDEVPGLVDQLAVLPVEAHLDEDVARIEFADLGGFFAGLDLRNDLGGQEDFENEIVEFFDGGELFDVRLHFVLLTGERVEGAALGASGRGGGGGHERGGSLAQDGNRSITWYRARSLMLVNSPRIIEPMITTMV